MKNNGNNANNSTSFDKLSSSSSSNEGNNNNVSLHDECLPIFSISLNPLPPAAEFIISFLIPPCGTYTVPRVTYKQAYDEQYTYIHIR